MIVSVVTVMTAIIRMTTGIDTASATVAIELPNKDWSTVLY